MEESANCKKLPHINAKKNLEKTGTRTSSAPEGASVCGGRFAQEEQCVQAEQCRLLPGIFGPEQLKTLSPRQLTQLSAEIRSVIVETVTKNGGHLASNLGVVELTIALHRVFDSPRDKIVWDVGHQCYAHKLLTGRAAVFNTLRKKDGLSGFPKRSESPHDVFNTGHASTSISAALGLLTGQHLDKINGAPGRVIAVIGDGALTGGLAYEALCHAGQLALPLIVILNDNRMSIGPSTGSLSHYLSRLSMKKHYQNFRRTFDNAVQKIPFAGKKIFDAVVRLKRAVKAVFYTDNFFVDLGFEYVGPVDGHDTRRLEQVLRDVRTIERPVVVHVLTQKGKGGGEAERDPGAFHGVEAAKSQPVGEDALLGDTPGGKFYGTFTQGFSDAALEAARRDKRIAAITAAMEKGTGLAAFKKEFPNRFFDAGIAEAHALTFAAGLAAAGLRPVAALYSTFLQRALDQVIHDIALQNLPVVFAVDRAGLVGGDGETHQGIFDIALLRPVPNLRILAPSCAAELRLMLDWALEQNAPTVIRYPKAQSLTLSNCPPLVEGRGNYIALNGEPIDEPSENTADVCIAFTGGLLPEVLGAARILAESGVRCALYNLRFIKPLDEDFLLSQTRRFRVFAIAEEGVKNGGFAEYVQALSVNARAGKARAVNASLENATRIIPIAIDNAVIPHAKREELLLLCGLSARKIAERLLDTRQIL